MKFSMSKNIFEHLLATWAKPKGSSKSKDTENQNFNEKEVEAELQGLIENINSVVRK